MAPAQVIDEKDLPPEVLALPAASAGAVLEVTGHGAVPDTSAQPLPGTVGAVVQDAGTDSQLMDAGITLGHPAGTPVTQMGSTAFHQPVDSSTPVWMDGLKAEAQGLLDAGRDDVWDVLTRKFEAQLILTALANTRGRRIEAAQRLGIGRNTITRKIQEDRKSVV